MQGFEADVVLSTSAIEQCHRPYRAALGIDVVLVELPPVNIVYPQRRLVPQKVSAFVEFARPRLHECLALIETQCSV